MKLLMLRGDHLSKNPSMERVVITEGKDVAYRTFKNNADEEIWVDGALLCRWQEGMGEADFRCSERFWELTGLYPYEWDAEYAKEGWPGYVDDVWYWREVSQQAEVR